jgi:Uma2 family endonuclease
VTAIIRGPHVSFSDEDLERLTLTNPGWQIERADDGALLVSPTSTPGGARSGEAFAQLYAYAKRVGGKAFDAATGFKTPGGGVVCPDASWMSGAAVARHAGERGYWQTMPEVAIEVASYTDDWSRLKRKIDKYVADGAEYAVAIDPESRATYAVGTPPSGLEHDVDAIINA